MQKGYCYALSAFVLWGLFPIYWKWLHQVSAFQLIGHRIVWSCVMLLGIVAVSREWGEFRNSINGGAVRIYAIAAILIGINWTIYVWAVNSNYVLETSLGYFM